MISVTALGDLGGREPVRLGGARAGDTVAVVGELGWSAAGYALWHNDIHGFDALRRRHLVPEPPYGQGRVAADAGATAMTDVSDGLLADLGHIAARRVSASTVPDALGADRDRARLGGRRDLGDDPWDWVLGGGEDHALVATFPGPPPAGWRVIGAVLDGPARVLVDGEVRGTEIRAGSRSERRAHAKLTLVTARPLNELVDDGWARALEPVGTSGRPDGGVPARRARAGPTLSARGPERVARLHLSRSNAYGC